MSQNRDCNRSLTPIETIDVFGPMAAIVLACNLSRFSNFYQTLKDCSEILLVYIVQIMNVYECNGKNIFMR